MKIDPKKFYWFRQMGDGTIRPLKYIPKYTRFVSNAGVFPEVRGPTGFTDPKDAIEKMKPDSTYLGSVRIDNPDPNIYAVFDFGSFEEVGTKRVLLVNGRKAAEYMVRLKIEDSNR